MEEAKIDKLIKELRGFLLFDVIEILEERNKTLLGDKTHINKNICVKIGENNNTIEEIKKLIDGKD